ncbi:MAG TPA: hypothetical protein VHO24_08320 [Opitutaceae bacterium]|nr:hypothetical protein [Opitutaceae bacterium]
MSTRDPGSSRGFYDNSYNSNPWSGSRLDNLPPSRPESLPIYFPPTPPTLGSPVPLPNPLLTPAQVAPEALQDYVNEIFYPALSTRITQKKITPRLQQRLDAYRAAKMKLQDELRARLVELRHADPATRSRELAQLARIQNPQIEALEKIADQLREELIRGDLFHLSIDWNVTRDWRLGKSLFRTAGDAILAQQQVMRAAAFYQRGLLPEQRALLREIAIELREANPRTAEVNDGVSPPLFFSPSPARLRLPPGLPEELREKIGRYEKEKSVLKQELRDTVYATDKAYFSVSRTRAIELLAERQWPRLAALEDLAEQIRVDFSYLPNSVAPPAPPPVSAGLAARIVIYLSEKQAVEAEILAKVGQIKRQFAIQRIAPGNGSDLKLVLSPGAQNQKQIDALKATLADFNRDIGGRQTDLRKDLDAIRRDLAREARLGEGQNIEDLLYDYAVALQQREEWRLYTDYQSAMLTPGLSSPQRRLLFDGAVQKLDLPLPGWELQPVRVVL